MKLMPHQTKVRFLKKVVIGGVQYDPGVCIVEIDHVPALLENGLAESLPETIYPEDYKPKVSAPCEICNPIEGGRDHSALPDHAYCPPPPLAVVGVDMAKGGDDECLSHPGYNGGITTPEGCANAAPEPAPVAAADAEHKDAK